MTQEQTPGETPAPETPAAEAAPAAEAVPAATNPVEEAVAPGYAFEGPALELGGLMVGPDQLSGSTIRIPLGMLNRHGLVAGATGTGKTKTLQLLAEQLSANGVPVFAADIKGDLSGIATAGEANDKLLARTKSVGQDWKATAFPVEYYALGGQGTGIPVRVTVTSFGPILLSRVLGLNDTQESSLGLVFHYADKQGLPLLDLQDLRAVVQHLTSEEGKADLKELGGLSAATAGVILRELIAFADQGAEAFFGEPEFDSADLLQQAPDGRGLVSLVELPNLQDRPAIFSTFLTWLLADLFHDLPEVGDVDKPKLVFFFDEAHLLFKDASKPFLESIAQTVRLIRSKGVGVFFVTQSPTDVPDDVLAQLGSRVQHQLRAHTPNDAKALKATVNTYPKSAYADLGEVITTLGIGEAIVTVMGEKGAPTPVAWTRLRAPESLMAPSSAESMEATVKASPRYARYAEVVDRESAREILAKKLEDGAAAAEKAKAEEEAADKPAAKKAEARRKDDGGGAGEIVKDVVKSSAFKQFMRTAAAEIARGMFGTARRRR
ncbi:MULTISPECIES: helicase HerA-like domain-containing protein [unclassified Nocardioides]|uniref:helicase HerA-like domain-containing protein n=1 Tax=unclassified Nocardioides TaxID=2615069 RepID=UPI000702DB9B|nr:MULTISPECIES: helicase HerA-like domain-containing protein [unclassified Nocardioides]KRC52947.1 ATPase [Nocardioides sp. Root79]KRC72478.1 ATPase [Nocardioides sp. Root240]